MATAGASGTGYGEALRGLKPGAFRTLVQRLPQGGSLQARRLRREAIQLYWRYSHDAVGKREPIGLYDPKSPPKQLTPTTQGYSIQAALEACRALARKHGTHVGGLSGSKAAEARAYAAAQALNAERSTKTLAALFEAYVAFLRAQGRKSAYEAELAFRLHVDQPFPKLAAKPAAEVTPDEILDALRRLVEQGKGRTANKVRSYIRAAFQCAIDVRTTASVPVVFKSFGVTFNPAAQTKRDARFDRADKRPLSAAELRKYWTRVKRSLGLEGAALRTHLLTGGQRIEQIVRLKWADVREDEITIYDSKGRPGHGARAHVIPLVDELKHSLSGLEREGEYVFSTREGNKPISNTTLSNWAHTAIGDALPGFQLKRVRSGIETLLAANGISKEIRGQLQSHGLTGVQARHYDGHDYLPEKRRALELLHELLERRATDKVIPMRSRH